MWVFGVFGGRAVKGDILCKGAYMGDSQDCLETKGRQLEQGEQGERRSEKAWGAGGRGQQKAHVMCLCKDFGFYSKIKILCVIFELKSVT